MTRLSTIPISPKTWPSWLAIALLMLLVKLPYPIVMRLGRQLGLLTQRLLKSRRRVTEINLARCFPELTDAARLALVRKTFAANGQGFMEAAFSWWAPQKCLEAIPYTITGLELLLPENRDQGLIILFPHLTTLEICGRFTAAKVPLSVVYQSQSNEVFDYVIRRERLRCFKYVFNRRNLRQIVGALRNKEAVGYLPDQDFGIENSVFAPFFGVSTATATATAKLASLANARVVMGSCIRRPHDAGYDILFTAFPASFPCSDEVLDATFINEQIEHIIKRDYSNYMWLHRRFKTRPAGENSFY